MPLRASWLAAPAPAPAAVASAAAASAAAASAAAAGWGPGRIDAFVSQLRHELFGTPLPIGADDDDDPDADVDDRVAGQKRRRAGPDDERESLAALADLADADGAVAVEEDDDGDGDNDNAYAQQAQKRARLPTVEQFVQLPELVVELIAEQLTVREATALCRASRTLAHRFAASVYKFGPAGAPAEPADLANVKFSAAIVKGLFYAYFGITSDADRVDVPNKALARIVARDANEYLELKQSEDRATQARRLVLAWRIFSHMYRSSVSNTDLRQTFAIAVKSIRSARQYPVTVISSELAFVRQKVTAPSARQLVHVYSTLRLAAAVLDWRADVERGVAFSPVLSARDALSFNFDSATLRYVKPGPDAEQAGFVFGGAGASSDQLQGRVYIYPVDAGPAKAPTAARVSEASILKLVWPTIFSMVAAATGSVRDSLEVARIDAVDQSVAGHPRGLLLTIAHEASKNVVKRVIVRLIAPPPIRSSSLFYTISFPQLPGRVLHKALLKIDVNVADVAQSDVVELDRFVQAPIAGSRNLLFDRERAFPVGDDTVPLPELHMYNIFRGANGQVVIASLRGPQSHWIVGNRRFTLPTNVDTGNDEANVRLQTNWAFPATFEWKKTPISAEEARVRTDRELALVGPKEKSAVNQLTISSISVDYAGTGRAVGRTVRYKLAATASSEGLAPIYRSRRTVYIDSVTYKGRSERLFYDAIGDKFLFGTSVQRATDFGMSVASIAVPPRPDLPSRFSVAPSSLVISRTVVSEKVVEATPVAE